MEQGKALCSINVPDMLIFVKLHAFKGLRIHMYFWSFAANCELSDLWCMFCKDYILYCVGKSCFASNLALSTDMALCLQVFRSRTPAEAIALMSRLLDYTPRMRVSPLQACAHNFFDELRDPSSHLPSGRKLPQLFDFSPSGEYVTTDSFSPCHVRHPHTLRFHPDGWWQVAHHPVGLSFPVIRIYSRIEYE